MIEWFTYKKKKFGIFIDAKERIEIFFIPVKG